LANSSGVRQPESLVRSLTVVTLAPLGENFVDVIEIREVVLVEAFVA
jgi:hypothetical protein